jgi:hypothetical protein
MRIDMKIQIPDTSMAEDDLIFLAAGYDRPRGTSYPAAWAKIQRRANRDSGFAKRVRAAINKHVPRNRQKIRWNKSERRRQKITKEDLLEFRRAFGKNGAPVAGRARKLYTREFGKPPEKFNLADLRHLARPNRHAREYIGAAWSLLTDAEKLRVENTPEFYFVAGGEIVDADLFYAAKLSRLLKRKIHPTKKSESQKRRRGR